ncbi:translation initiation factor IF-2-like [Cervus canadensis]|uniref:translation initiation factor IF-2-like n=1 Tax=Cervus canadensis TaxID=1574408 RepID=UPI001C9E8A1C|nr:translation initiation factor IF-2-like [Cervus canadensis]
MTFSLSVSLYAPGSRGGSGAAGRAAPPGVSPGRLPGGGAAGELGTPKGASWAALRISVPAGGKSESGARGRATCPRLHGQQLQQRWAAPRAPLPGPAPREGLPTYPYRVSRRDPTPAPRPGPQVLRSQRAPDQDPHPPSPRARPCLPLWGGCRRRPLSGAEEASRHRERSRLLPAAPAPALEPGAGPARPRPAPPRPAPPRPSSSCLAPPPAGVQAAARGAQCAAGPEAGARGGWCVTCPAVVPQPLQPPPPSSACAIAPPGGHRGAPGGSEAVSLRRRLWETLGSLRWRFPQGALIPFAGEEDLEAGSGYSFSRPLPMLDPRSGSNHAGLELEAARLWKWNWYPAGQLPVFIQTYLCSDLGAILHTRFSLHSSLGDGQASLDERKHLSGVFHGGSESRQVSRLEGALGQLFPMF